MEINVFVPLNPAEYKDKIKEVVDFFSDLKKERPDMAVHIEAQITNQSL